ncbi:hypothetical protein A20C1_00305 [marine actinobacterium PHSC20C1]|nr:hypothetical protein A20C1_00305 [marine actinobacterium PHSC20C1]
MVVDEACGRFANGDAIQLAVSPHAGAEVAAYRA